MSSEQDLLKPGQVAAMFAVPKTVTRWAKLGKLNTVMTLGGHRRYPAEVRELLERASRNGHSGGSGG